MMFREAYKELVLKIIIFCLSKAWYSVFSTCFFFSPSTVMFLISSFEVDMVPHIYIKFTGARP